MQNPTAHTVVCNKCNASVTVNTSVQVRHREFDKWFKRLCRTACVEYNNFPINTDDPYSYIEYYIDGYSVDDVIHEEAQNAL